jgi:hypothetical protein
MVGEIAKTFEHVWFSDNYDNDNDLIFVYVIQSLKSFVLVNLVLKSVVINGSAEMWER